MRDCKLIIETCKLGCGLAFPQGITAYKNTQHASLCMLYCKAFSIVNTPSPNFTCCLANTYLKDTQANILKWCCNVSAFRPRCGVNAARSAVQPFPVLLMSSMWKHEFKLAFSAFIIGMCMASACAFWFAAKISSMLP